MNLRSPITKLQKRGARFYLLLVERFSENSLIRDTWTAMAQDLGQQIDSLRALRPSFWKLLKRERKSLLVEMKEITFLLDQSRSDHLSQWSMKTCFTRTLDFEERLMLKVYSPVIYKLRTEWNDRAVNFYVLVNAHLTRLIRLIQPSSGDPTLIQRCTNLREQFEKESQGPVPELVWKKKIAKRKPVRVRRLVRPALKGVRKLRIRRRVTTSRSRGMVKRAKALVKRSKPLVKRISVSRRRVRR